ncbi:Serine/threonine-protein kinase 11-interacting protein [Lamellibrachia satsuma]|nr:Serine/threonine-protein kinase 11-interacting protein [Lamellibrachia satsuma]
MAVPDKTWRQKKTIQELASLLRESGERILTGQSKLSLSTGCLSMLSEGFKAIRDEETGNETFEVLPSNSHRLPEIISLQFLYDFIQKTKAFKLTHSNETIQGHVSIAVFRALRSLDLRKIPLHLLRGLQLQRPRLTAIACSRCLRNLQGGLAPVQGSAYSKGL